MYRAIRDLARSWRFTSMTLLLIVASVSISGGVSTFVAGYFLRVLPIPRPGEIVAFRWSDSGSSSGLGIREWHGDEKSFVFPYQAYDAMRNADERLDNLIAFTGIGEEGTAIILKHDNSPTSTVIGEAVSGNYFSSLSVAPARGRLIFNDSERAEVPSIVISNSLWLQGFGGDPNVIGRSVYLNGNIYAVVGVAGKRFSGLLRNVSCDFWVPIKDWPETRAAGYDPGSWRFLLAVRDPSHGGGEQLALIATNTLRALVTSFTGDSDGSSASKLTVQAVKGMRGFSGRDSGWSSYLQLLALLAATFQVVCCAGLMLLNLARSKVREPRIAISVALGMTPKQLVLSFSEEALVIGCVGTVLSWPLSLGIDTFTSRTIGSIAKSSGVTIAGAGFTWISLVPPAILVMTTIVVASLYPLLKALRVSPGVLMRRTLSTGNRGGSMFLGEGLLFLQIIIATVVLLVGAQCIGNAIRLARIPLGYSPTNVVTMDVELQGNTVGSEGRIGEYEAMEDKLQGLRGVSQTSFSSLVMLGGKDMKIPISHLDQDKIKTDPTSINLVTKSFMEVMDVKLVRGRYFQESDMATHSRAAIVNEAFARSAFYSLDAIGKKFGLGNATSFDVVGITKDVLYEGPDKGAVPIVYLPYKRLPGVVSHIPWGVYVEIKTVGKTAFTASDVLNDIRSIDSTAVLSSYNDQQNLVRDSVAPEEVLGKVCVLLSVCVGVVTFISLYGMQVQRIEGMLRAIAIKCALGASRLEVIRIMLRGTVAVAALGFLCGMGVFVVFSRLALSVVLRAGASSSSQVFLVFCALMGFSFVSIYGPIRRVLRRNVMETLRE